MDIMLRGTKVGEASQPSRVSRGDNGIVSVHVPLMTLYQGQIQRVTFESMTQWTQGNQAFYIEDVDPPCLDECFIQRHKEIHTLRDHRAHLMLVDVVFFYSEKHLTFWEPPEE